MHRHAVTLAVSVATVAGVTATVAPPALAWTPPPSRACGATSSDTAMARQLSPKIRSAGLVGVSADQVSCARQVVAQVKAEGFNQRAGLIALMTVITETGLHNYVGGDRDSLGLFQQRPSMGWGSATNIMKPSYSTHAFLAAMAKRYPNNRWVGMDPGVVAQGVQRSAYPSRYNRERSSATTLLNALWSGAAPAPTPPPVTTQPGGKGTLTVKVPATGVRLRAAATTASRQLRVLRPGTSVVASCEKVGRSIRSGGHSSVYWMYLPSLKGYVSNAAMGRSGSVGLKAC